MNEPLRVRDLLDECKKQVKEGNGDKYIMISMDDEGNWFHYLWYSFSDQKSIFEESLDKEVSNENNTISLG